MQKQPAIGAVDVHGRLRLGLCSLLWCTNAGTLLRSDWLRCGRLSTGFHLAGRPILGAPDSSTTDTHKLDRFLLQPAQSEYPNSQSVKSFFFGITDFRSLLRSKYITLRNHLKCKFVFSSSASSAAVLPAVTESSLAA
jgi:hypothetical protein